MKNVEHLFSLEQELNKLLENPKGTIMHGLGIFPGLSNLLVKDFYLEHKNLSFINLGIRYNLFSGAGKAMCEMMSKSLTNPSLYISKDKIMLDKPVGEKIIMKWTKNELSGNRVALCDLKYINRKKGLDKANTILSFMPKWITSIAKVFNYLPKYKLTQKLLYLVFFFLRGSLLSGVSTKMEIVVSNGKVNYSLILDNAFVSGGESILWISTEIIKPKFDIKRGIYCFDEVCDLKKFLSFQSRLKFNNNITYLKS